MQSVRTIARGAARRHGWLYLGAYLAVAAGGPSEMYFSRQPAATEPNSTAKAAQVVAKVEGSGPPECGVHCVLTLGCNGYSYDAKSRRCSLLSVVSNETLGRRTVYQAVAGQSLEDNVALNKTVSMSSEHGACVTSDCCLPQCLVDGDPATYAITSFFASNPFPWMIVNLGDEYLVSAVTVIARQDCCGWRAHDFDIRVGRSSHPNKSGFFDGHLCWHRSENMTSSEPIEVYTCPVLLRGAYVSMQVTVSAADRILNVAEISVMAWNIH